MLRRFVAVLPSLGYGANATAEIVPDLRFGDAWTVASSGNAAAPRLALVLLGLAGHRIGLG